MPINKPIPDTPWLVLSPHAFKAGLVLAEFVLRLHFCQAQDVAHLLASKDFRLNGKVWDDPASLIHIQDLPAGSVASWAQKRVVIHLARDTEPAPIFQSPSTTWIEVLELTPRWDEYNETEGLCRGRWLGALHHFKVTLFDDEWQKIPVGGTWVAQVSFSCLSPVEISTPDTSLTDSSTSSKAELRQLSDVRYQLSAPLLRPLSQQLWLVALPHPLVVDLDHSRCQVNLLQPGAWLTAQGILEARMPE